MKNETKNKIKNHFIERKVPYLMGVCFVAWFFLLIFLAVKVRKYDSVAFTIFGADIAWYAVFILSGLIIAALIAYREAEFLGLNKDHLTDAILFTVPIAIIGARLYYIIFNPVGGFMDIINIRGGGLAIHGAVIASIIFLFFYTKWKKMNLLTFLDIAAVGFLVGQIIGRWGNFFNQEAHGGPMSENAYLFLKNVIPNFILTNMNIGGTYYHPTFLYEGLWNLLGLILLLIIRRKRWFKLGDMIGLYLMWYGLGRGLLIEPFRTDALLFFINKNPENIILNMLNRVNVVLSLTLFTMGGIAFIIVKNIIKPDIPYYYDIVLENKARIEKEQAKLEKEQAKALKKQNKK